MYERNSIDFWVECSETFIEYFMLLAYDPYDVREINKEIWRL